MKITDIRLTNIWVDARPEVFGSAGLGRVGACVDAKNYAQLFKQVLDTDSDPLLTLPWPRRPNGGWPERNHFWMAYVVNSLQRARPSDAGDICWAALTPLRRKSRLVRVAKGRRCFLEGWYFPHGVALTATLWQCGQLDAKSLQRAADDFFTRNLKATWPGGNVQTLKLTGLAKACMDLLRAEAFGITGDFVLQEPMRVATVVSVLPETGDTPQTEMNMLSAAFNCVGGQLGAAAQPGAGGNIYTTTRGRLVWRLDKATVARGETHTLACLHRNLVVGTCVTSSLIDGVDAGLAAWRQAGMTLNARVEPYFRRLSQQLERIHNGVDTYAQACLGQQTTAAKAHINELRGLLGLANLP